MFLIQSGRDLIEKKREKINNKNSNIQHFACYSLSFFNNQMFWFFCCFFFKCKAILIYRFIYKALHFHLKSIIWLLCNCYGFFSSSEIHNFQCLEWFFFYIILFFFLLSAKKKKYIKMAWSWYSGTLAFLRQDPLFHVCAR